MTTTPGPITEAIPDITKLRETFEDLNEQVATLTEENETLAARSGELEVEVEALGREVVAANAATAEANERAEAAHARAGDLAKLVDAAAAGQSIERVPGQHQAGDLVEYVFRDVVTSSQLSGPGIVVRPGEGALVVAPLSPAQLQLPTEAVRHLTVAEMNGEAEPEDEDA